MTSLLTGSEPGVFCGGDLAGVAETAVEAVNDGKLAAWTIHRYLQGLHGVQVYYQLLPSLGLHGIQEYYQLLPSLGLHG